MVDPRSVQTRLLTMIMATSVWLTVAVRPGPGDEPTAAPPFEPAKGISVILGLPVPGDPASVVRRADGNELLIYFQSPDVKVIDEVRAEAEQAGLLGKRIFAECGALRTIHLADNLADTMFVAAAEMADVPRAEILRVLHPGATAVVGQQKMEKPLNDTVDYWTHPYHGPDNNPQSTDQIARAPFRTQFLAGPLFSPMPEVTVAAHGRIYKAFGHIAHKKNQNVVLNKLMCINAYNGTILWQRALRPGFMIHRNTMVATADGLLLADDQSCKVIDGTSGKVLDEIVVPDGVADGPVWKWMALVDGTLYALVGHEEVRVDTITSRTEGIGHWPWGMWKGHEYSDPRSNFGYGRTFLAIDPNTKRVLWTYQDDQYLDSRGVCMGDGKIYFYCPEKFLACLDAKTGAVAWKNTDTDLLAAIGPNGPAQHYVTGYATTTYIKCNDKQVFFAGPQRAHLVVASADDGHLLWQKPQGNLQVVLRDDGIYCAGPQQGDEGAGAKYAYDGERLATLPIRRACTRATGSIDSVFYRTTGGTVRVNVAANSAEHIAPMRPPCQDGVLISDGLLFWGPWMCGCQLSLYGHICLGPAGASGESAAAREPQLQSRDGDPAGVAALESRPGDWPTYQHDSWRSSYTSVETPLKIRQLWSCQLPTDELPTAPVVAGGMTFLGDRSGAVRALNGDGQLVWSMRTGGPIYYPPSVADSRLFVGSADGQVYALEATTGRVLWSYRVAPTARRIPVYGKLISTWPVAGGVVVEDGVVYAAAGIAHYDGTYVVALDAATGKTLWTNDSSGALADDVNCGISLQGELLLRDGELKFLGGGAYQFARYDPKTGRCLNQPRSEVTSQFQTAFYPYYPSYAKYSSLNHTFPGGRTLAYFSSYDGSNPTPLGLLEPLSQSQRVPNPPQNARQPRRKPVWQTGNPELFTAFVITPDALIAGGQQSVDNQSPTIRALEMDNGKHRWDLPLPALPVKSGIAMDQRQHMVIAMENGQVLCFGPADP